MAKVFLSHSSKDAALANDVHTSLAGNHHDTFLDHDPGDGIEPGADWERTLYDKLQWADAIVCLVTQHYTQSLWCSIEVAIAKAQGRLILPVAAEAGVKHPLLKPVQHIPYASDAKEGLARLAASLAAIDAGGGLAWDEKRAVFPGLVAFDTGDRAMFFGRDSEIRDIVKDIRARVGQRQPRALVVVGASGSGKSSLVRAGVIPGLLDDTAWWRLLPMMPGDAPFVALADAIARGRKEVNLPPDLDRVTTGLRTAGGLAALAREILLSAPSDRQHLLITIDQMEELFTRASDGDRTAFLTTLANAAEESDGPVAVIGTLRSEFLGELLRVPEGRVVRERPFLLAPMGAEHLEDVIAKPAQKARVAFDRDLVRRLVTDTGSGEALPLLAFTLSRLVDGVGPGDRVDLARYQLIGGVQKSVEIQAEAALSRAQAAASCTETEALDALMAFVTLDEAGRPARRRKRRDDFPASQRAIVATFEHARLLTTYAEDGVEYLSVAHETLFTSWQRMAQAIADAAATLKVRRDLEHAFTEWDRSSRSTAFLWRGERLAQAKALRESDLGANEWTFVQESARVVREAAEREAEILADRVRQKELLYRDPELALLYLLVAVDEYAVTPSVIAAMRYALSMQRMVGRVGPLEREILFAMVSDDGELMAVADLGTNQRIRPSTRAQPPPPVGDLQLSVWRIDANQRLRTVDLHGRKVFGIEWSRDRQWLAIFIDDRIDILTAATLALLSSITNIEAGSLQIRERRWFVIAPDKRRIEIDRETAPQAFVLDEARAEWKRVPSPARGDELSNGTRAVAHPFQSTRLIACAHAGRLLDVVGTRVDVWRGQAADDSSPANAAESSGVTWIRGPSAGNDVLALSPDGRCRCLGPMPRVVEEGSPAERSLPSGFAVAAGFSGDGRLLALASRLEISIVALSTNKIVATVGSHGDEEGDTYSSVALNRDGMQLITGSLGGGRSHLWDVATGRRLRPLGGRWVGMSPDGSHFAVATSSSLEVHLPDGTELEIGIGKQPASSFGFDPHNASLLAVRSDLTEFSLPDGHDAVHYASEFDALAFSPDGSYLLGRTPGGIVRWPDRSSDAVIARARKAVFRSLTPAERDNFELRRLS